MTAHEFGEWLDHMWFSHDDAAARLGVEPGAIAAYEREGAPATVGLACAAIATGLAAWQPPRRRARLRRQQAA
ncbi:hypothetical protein VQ042_20705 [Aurantimonas sp. A2-1-M11]|uniref:hypothetical protein n=1 Tax=Aurantimonas sp. A2-1-M11 TaxID=3113712 RepID=UPI002F956EB9